jgi:hypothetical protein
VAAGVWLNPWFWKIAQIASSTLLRSPDLRRWQQSILGGVTAYMLTVSATHLWPIGRIKWLITKYRAGIKARVAAWVETRTRQILAGILEQLLADLAAYEANVNEAKTALNAIIAKPWDSQPVNSKFSIALPLDIRDPDWEHRINGLSEHAINRFKKTAIPVWIGPAAPCVQPQELLEGAVDAVWLPSTVASNLSEYLREPGCAPQAIPTLEKSVGPRLAAPQGDRIAIDGNDELRRCYLPTTQTNIEWAMLFGSEGNIGTIRNVMLHPNLGSTVELIKLEVGQFLNGGTTTL